MSRRRSRSIAKGIIAGLIGGIVATAAKNAVERAYPPRKAPDTGEQPELTTRKIGRLELTVRNKPAIRKGMHWGLGAAAGAAYGAAAELYPATTSKQGASFGMAMIALSQDNLLPAVGLAEKKPQSKREHTSELVSFVTYGVVTETVRRVVRWMID